jgi:nucleoside-diphosphate-sugar epimerase
MKACVTGATGFIGYQLCSRLLSAGHQVRGLDLIPPEAGQHLPEFVHGDIRDPAAVRRAVEGADAVFSLAAAHHDFGIDQATYFAVNETGSQVLCDELDRAGIRRVCWYSSCAVYGDCPAPRHEDATPRPSGHYGASKLAGERVFRAWTEKGQGRSALVIRPTITFGPGNVANMYSLIRQVASGRFVIAGRASNYKSLSYVENLLDATVYLWERGFSGLEIYNFVEKPDLTSRQIAEAVGEALGKASPGPTLPLPLVLALALPFDAVTAVTGRDLGISSMRVRKLFSQETRFEADKLAATGFRSSVPVREGIARMVRWWKSAGVQAAPKWRQPPAVVQGSSSP